MPPTPTKSSIENAKKILKDPNVRKDSLDLQETFGQQWDLIVYALQDTDNDGIPDFRVNIEDGKFYEGDLDIDNDGIRNIYDAEPYNKMVGGKDNNNDGIPDEGFVDHNHNKIPDHIDFEYTKKRLKSVGAFAEIQLDLFKKHKIILVERSANFTLKSVEAIHDTITRVYRHEFGQNKVLPTLRTIAAENFPLLYPEKPVETDAFYNSPVQTLVVYGHSVRATRLVLLGLFVHEVGHALQYMMDFNATRPDIENLRKYYMSPNFMAAMTDFDWEIIDNRFEDWEDTVLYYPVFEIGFPDYSFLGKPNNEWMSWLRDINDEVGQKYLQDSRVSKLFIVGDYSMTNPWEWLSDNEIAYVFTELENFSHAEHCKQSTQKKKLREFMLEQTADFWADFYYPNFEGSKIQKHLRSVYPISRNDLGALHKRYLKPLNCGFLKN